MFRRLYLVTLTCTSHTTFISLKTCSALILTLVLGYRPCLREVFNQPMRSIWTLEWSPHSVRRWEGTLPSSQHSTRKALSRYFLESLVWPETHGLPDLRAHTGAMGPRRACHCSQSARCMTTADQRPDAWANIGGNVPGYASRGSDPEKGGERYKPAPFR